MGDTKCIVSYLEQGDTKIYCLRSVLQRQKDCKKFDVYQAANGQSWSLLSSITELENG